MMTFYEICLKELDCLGSTYSCRYFEPESYDIEPDLQYFNVLSNAARRYGKSSFADDVFGKERYSEGELIFGEDHLRLVAQTELMHKTQKKGESLQELEEDIERL
uniref:Uncharacterized protein n=1 Tax=Megaselia scalaris TaxID=36166 RepID=T1GUK7_MEGSC